MKRTSASVIISGMCAGAAAEDDAPRPGGRPRPRPRLPPPRLPPPLPPPAPARSSKSSSRLRRRAFAPRSDAECLPFARPARPRHACESQHMVLRPFIRPGDQHDMSPACLRLDTQLNDEGLFTGCCDSVQRYRISTQEQ